MSRLDDEAALDRMPSIEAAGDAIVALGDELARLAADIERLTCRMLLLQSKMATCQRVLALHNKCPPRVHRTFPELNHHDNYGQVDN